MTIEQAYRDRLGRRVAQRTRFRYYGRGYFGRGFVEFSVWGSELWQIR